jgi:hypothetical protein
MPATILSDNGASSGTAGLKTSGSNDGILVLQTTTSGGTATAAITIDTTQRSKFPTTIGVGDATPSTSGSGITFPATQSASSNANTLDDYEEGTFTPELKFGGNAVSLTYNSRAGIYTKIGRCVTVSFVMVLSAKGSSSGNATISLPFASDEYGQPNQPGYAGGFPYYSGMTSATKAGFIVGNIGAAGYVMASTTTTDSGYTATEANFNNNTVFAMTITYNTAT